MKKWLSVICSGLLGVLTFAFMGITAIKLVADAVLTSTSYSYNGYQLMTDSDLKDMAELIETNALTIYKVFAIILLVMAGIAIVYCLLKVLANLNVIKLPKAVDYVFVVVAVLAVVSAICAVIAALVYRSNVLETIGVNYVTIPIYPGLVLTLVETVVFSVVGAISALGKKKA